MQLAKETGVSRAVSKRTLVAHGNDYTAARNELAPELGRAEAEAAAAAAAAATAGGVLKHGEIVDLLNAHFADYTNGGG